MYGLKFAFNDTFKTMVAGPGKKKLDTSELLWVGTLAGVFQTVITYPLETIRTRLSIGELPGGASHTYTLLVLRARLPQSPPPSL